MKAFTKFCLASFLTLGSKQSPEKLCQLIPFRNNTGPSTSEIYIYMNVGVECTLAESAQCRGSRAKYT